MKKTKLLTLLITACLIILIETCSSAISLTVDNKEVNPGEEFVVELKFDENIVLGNSYIQFDSELFEFLGTDEEKVDANTIEADTVAWMRTDMATEPEGIKTLSFKFKAKEDISKKAEATFKVYDLVVVGENSKEFNDNEIGGTREFKVAVNGKSGNIFVKILIILIIIVIVLLVINKLKSKKKRH